MGGPGADPAVLGGRPRSPSCSGRGRGSRAAEPTRRAQSASCWKRRAFVEMREKVAFPRPRRAGRRRTSALRSSGPDVVLGSLRAPGPTPVSWGGEGRPQPFQTAGAVLRRWAASRQLAPGGGQRSVFSSLSREPEPLPGHCPASGPTRPFPWAGARRSCAGRVWQSRVPPRAALALAHGVGSVKPEARRYCPGPGLAHGGQEPQVGAWQGRLGGPLPGMQTLAPLTLDPVRPPVISGLSLSPRHRSSGKARLPGRSRGPKETGRVRGTQVGGPYGVHAPLIRRLSAVRRFLLGG